MQLKDFDTNGILIKIRRMSWPDEMTTFIFADGGLSSHRWNKEDEVIIDPNYNDGRSLQITRDDMCADDWEEVTNV